MATSVYSRALQRAAEILGSREKLCRELRVPRSDLELWLADKAEPPRGIFLKVVDLILSDMPEPRDSDPGDTSGSREAASGSGPSSSMLC